MCSKNNTKAHNFHCLAKHDFSVGLLRPAAKWIPVVLIFAASCGYLLLLARAERESGQLASLPTLGDIVAYVFQGRKLYNPTEGDAFTIPFGYLLMNLYLAYLVGNYPVKDLLGYGQQILLRTRRRSRWWVSKCLWCAGTVLSFYLLGYLVMLAAAAVSGGFSLALTPEIGAYSELYAADPVSRDWLPSALLLPAATSLALSLLQLALMTVVKPVGAYIVIAVVVAASAYFYTPLLIGNYAMLLRNASFLEGGIAFWPALLVDLGIALAAAAAGFLAFRRYDILDKV
ncbi:MAG TPA: hypothetical protein H9674_07220 [Firmicutes bacterium]|nr:hypothetical protein [Bacillota bacterium]